MSANQSLTVEELKSQLRYEPDTGDFYRIARPRGSNAPMGLITTKTTEAGYIRIRVLGRKFMAHQLAYVYMTHVWPTQVDHDNRNRSDNRWCNLSESSDVHNRKNQSLRKTNNTGMAGVIWDDKRQRYVVRVTNNYKQIWLGQFKTLLAAEYARHAANLEYGFSHNHGSSLCKYKK